MKIVTAQEFYEMPTGTVFSFYEPEICTGLCVLEEVYPNWMPSDPNNPRDFVYTDLVAGTMTYSDLREEWEVCITERDGLFDNERRFMIYEPQDVQMIVERLTRGEDTTNGQ